MALIIQINGNTVVGENAMETLVLGPITGENNTAVGFNALKDMLPDVSDCTAVGAFALEKNISSVSTAVGAYSLSNITNNDNDANNNTAIGNYTMRYRVSGSDNTAIGFKAMQGNTSIDCDIKSSGNHNTATGSNAMHNITTGFANTANGSHVMENITSGYQNTASGYNAMQSIKSGYNNTAFGQDALNFNVNGCCNTATGYKAMYSTTGSNNTANGYQALIKNILGENNTATGFCAMSNNMTGNYNTASGSNAGKLNDGDYNTFIGYLAGSELAPGSSHNTFIGANTSTPDINSMYRTVIGAGAGAKSLFDNSIVLGTINDTTVISGGHINNTLIKNTNYLIGNNDHTVIGSPVNPAIISYTLPNLTSLNNNGRTYVIKNSGTGNINVIIAGNNRIINNGPLLTTFPLSTGDSRTFVFYATNPNIVGNFNYYVI